MDILKQHLKTSAKKLKLLQGKVFQMDLKDIYKLKADFKQVSSDQTEMPKKVKKVLSSFAQFVCREPIYTIAKMK